MYFLPIANDVLAIIGFFNLYNIILNASHEIKIIKKNNSFINNIINIHLNIIIYSKFRLLENNLLLFSTIFKIVSYSIYGYTLSLLKYETSFFSYRSSNFKILVEPVPVP